MSVTGRIDSSTLSSWAAAFCSLRCSFVAAAAAGAFSAEIRFQDASIPGSGGVDFARAFAYALLFTFGVKVAGLFMTVTSTVGMRTGAIPRWLVYVTWVLAAALLLSVSFYEVIILVFPVWVATISVAVLVLGGAPDRPYVRAAE